MAEQISSDNTKKLLLEGGGAKAAPQPRPARPHRRSGNADIVVENATEKTLSVDGTGFCHHLCRQPVL